VETGIDKTHELVLQGFAAFRAGPAAATDPAPAPAPAVP
jgi:hypothetical protein